MHGGSDGLGYAGLLDLNWARYGARSGWKTPYAEEFIQQDEIPPIRMNDGPQGFNAYQEKLQGSSLQWPALLNLAATFDTEAARKMGEGLAVEFTRKGAGVILGPAVDLIRVPGTGRSYETLSGEDPLLGRNLARHYVRALQKNHVIATPKH